MGAELKVRVAGRVERIARGSLGDALAEAKLRAQGLSDLAPRRPVKGFRDYEPVQQVFARIELAGPGLLNRKRGGLDVRGDGSVEAFTGRLRRSVVAQEAGEDAATALARVLGVTPDPDPR